MSRPVSATIFGVLNLAFAIWGVVGTLITVAMLWMGPNPAMPNPVLDMMRDDATYWLVTQLSLASGLVASIVLGVAGVGLLKGARWGRLLSIGYAVYAIVAGIVGAGVHYAFLMQPMMARAREMEPGPEQMGLMAGALGGVLGSCFGVIYPIVLLIFMLRRGFASALSGDDVIDARLA